MWQTLRKTGTGLYVAYANTHSGNLSAKNTRLRTDPHIELALDLSGNLRTRNTDVNSYRDARELADGGIKRLELVQIDDERIIGRIGERLALLRDPPRTWILTIELEGSYSFPVRPEASKLGNQTSLFLYVESKSAGGV